LDLIRNVKLASQYSVALCSIDFADSISTPKTETTSNKNINSSQDFNENGELIDETSDSHQGIFSNFLGDDPHVSPVILVEEDTINSVLLNKSAGENWDVYVAKFNLYVGGFPGINITSYFDGASRYPQSDIKISNELLYIPIPLEMAEILGFKNKTVFRKGVHRSSDQLDEEKYKMLQPGQLQVKIISIKQTAIPVVFPVKQADQSVEHTESVLDNVVSTMSNSGFEISMPVVDSVLSVEFEEGSKPYRFQLPATVSSLLGLNDGFVFTQNKEILVTSVIHEKDEPPKITVAEKKREELLSHTLGNQILVHCDIVNPSFYGSSCANLLRTIPRKTYNSLHHFDFFPLQFHKLNCKELSHIQLRLTDTNFVEIPDQPYPTTVVLLFVKTRLY